jgi:hypothetical protein
MSADSVVQLNLPQFTEPHVEKSYQPQHVKRPGTIEDWGQLVSVLSGHSEALYRDARILRSKRAEALNAKQGSNTQLLAQRDFDAVLKRATDHCRALAHDLLATGMSREHLENFLEQCGTEHDRRPEYAIGLLYSKLMGIEFEEQRNVVETDENGEQHTVLKTERKTYCWASVLPAHQVDDFFLTTRTFAENMPPLSTRFRSGQVRL